MPPKQNGPVAGGTAIRAGYQVTGQRFDTANRSAVQPADPFPGIRLRGFRPLPKGALIGFADIGLPGGLLVHECPVFRAKDAGARAALPAKPVVNRDRKQKADINGKRQFCAHARMAQSRTRQPILRCRHCSYRASFPRRARRHPQMNAAETIARALRLRRAGREFTGKCPSCGYASGFAVTERDGRVLLYCAAGGCTQSDLWAALTKAGVARSAEALEPRPRRRATFSAVLPRSTGEHLTLPVLTLSVAEAGRRDMALKLWRRTLPATPRFGPPGIVASYLRARRIVGAIPATVRYLPEALHPCGQRAPAMVALVEHVSRGPVAVHRTFLRPDGSGKAAVDPAKMTLGPCKGGAVRLAPAWPILAIAEGIESALSYMQRTGIPTWAALSAGGMRNLILPDDVAEVVIAADPDPVGMIAARVAARRWLDEGRLVAIARPPLGVDFNDLAQAAAP
jgi:hypothetical protein